MSHQQKPYHSVKGKGFVQPNALLQAASATSGVVLSATGTMRFVNSSADSNNGNAAEADKMSFSSLGASAPSGGGPQRRGRGSNFSAAPSSFSATSSTTEATKKTAPKSRADIAEVPYSNRVWRNIVMQYSDGQMIDPTPLAILGCGTPNVGGVKGLEGYYAPPLSTITPSPTNLGKALSGPFTASCDNLFTAALNDYNAVWGHPSVVATPSPATATSSSASAAGGLAKPPHKSSFMNSDDDDAEDDDDDEDAYESRNVTISLPMMKPPMVRPPTVAPSASASVATNKKVGGAAAGTTTTTAAPTMAMIMNHTISGNIRFTYTDYDGVTSAAIVPVIGGVNSNNNANNAATKALLAADDEDNEDDDEGGTEDVSAYLNPKAKANRQYIVKKSDLSEDDRQLFDKLWTVWRNSYTAKGAGAAGSNAANTNSASSQAAASSFASNSGRNGGAKSAGAKRGREEEGNDADMMNDIDAYLRGEASSSAAGATSNNDSSNNNTSALSEEDEIARMIRATEEELAALQRELA